MVTQHDFGSRDRRCAETEGISSREPLIHDRDEILLAVRTNSELMFELIRRGVSAPRPSYRRRFAGMAVGEIR